MQIRKNLLLVVLYTYSIVASAQNLGLVRGTLKDKFGAVVPSLTVRLEGTPLGAVTDAAGGFAIRNVPPASYTLVVTGIGYKPLQRTVAVAAGQETVVALTVEEASVDIAGVTVVGRSAVQETNRQAFNVTAVDAKQLYNTTLDLAGALDRVAGIRVRESGGVGSNFNLSLNGFSGNHVRYFIDGIPMDGFGSSFQINNIPINAAERIEVYKGVVPIWLGSDALGGAINIVTGNRQRNYVDASYSFGSFNTHRSVVNAAATSRSGLTAQISAFQNYSDNNYRVKVDAADINTGAYEPGKRVRRFHDTYHNETLIANVGVVDKRFADKLLLGVTVGKNYKEIQTGARMVSVFGGWHRRGNILMPTLKYKKENLVKGLDVTLNANYNLGSEQNIDTMNVRYDWLGNYKRIGTSGERSRSLYKYRNNNGLATAMLNYRLGEHHALALSNVFNTFNRKGADALNPAVVDQPLKTQKNVLGLGYSYNVSDDWSASVFGKHITQHNVVGAGAGKATTNKLGYGVAATYFVRPELQLKGSYELTNRMPEAQEIFGDVENQEGNPGLRPEKSNNVNLGLSYNYAIGPDDRLLVTANAVYRHSSNFIYNRLNNNQSRLVADNREGVRTVGADAEVRYSHKTRFSAGATLTYQYLQNMQRYEPGYTGVSPVYHDQLPNIPYLFGNADASFLLPEFGGSGNSLSMGYNLQYVHEFYLYWPSRGGDKLNISQQLSHDLNVVYSLKNGRYNLGLEGRNLANALLYDNFSLQKPGRAFYVNFRCFFNKTTNR
ncbi:TonB-dependent receptor [Solirubrum puertoriconensis]|uniref:Energy transducer TonB n=1 Tax=Solirubrum puertoriconensis TaxID=1751427 RepID=A0A9X0HND5_SOLP1|nr:TonB-dependent receptor [Solirubrum puertoriconensis]KUG09159.1 energy transducer TonB [Solirubrum puertoriconensis]